MSAQRTKGERWIDGVPDYLYAAGIRRPSKFDLSGKGGWQFITEAELRSQARPGPGHTLKSQLWAVGMLHGPRNKQELCIVWYKNNPKSKKEQWKFRTMTPGDMAAFLINEAVEYYGSAELSEEQGKLLRQRLREKEYSKENIRRGLAQLELDGLAERRRKGDGKLLRDMTPDQCRMLSGGQVEISFFFVPKEADPGGVKKEWASMWESILHPNGNPPGSDADPEVGIICLPKREIPLMLKGLKVGLGEIFANCLPLNQLPEKQAAKALAAMIAKPEYHDALRGIWENSRKALLSKLREIVAAEAEVSPPGLPTETDKVDAPGTPDVVPTGAPKVGVKSRQGISSSSSRGSRSHLSGRAEKVEEADRPAPDPPARPQSEFDQKLKNYLLQTAVATPLDDVMFQRIRAPLTPELFGQFVKVADDVKNPRKWAVYESIAKQVAARGPVAPGAGQKEDPLLKRMKEEAERRKSWETS